MHCSGLTPPCSELRGEAGLTALPPTTAPVLPTHLWAPAPPGRFVTRSLSSQLRAHVDPDLKETPWTSCKYVPRTQKSLALFRLRPAKSARSAPAVLHVAIRAECAAGSSVGQPAGHTPVERTCSALVGKFKTAPSSSTRGSSGCCILTQLFRVCLEDFSDALRPRAQITPPLIFSTNLVPLLISPRRAWKPCERPGSFPRVLPVAGSASRGGVNGVKAEQQR